MVSRREALVPFPLFNPRAHSPEDIPNGIASFDRAGVVSWETPYLWSVKIRNPEADPELEQFRDGWAVTLGGQAVFYSRSAGLAFRFIRRAFPWYYAIRQPGALATWTPGSR